MMFIKLLVDGDDDGAMLLLSLLINTVIFAKSAEIDCDERLGIKARGISLDVQDV